MGEVSISVLSKQTGMASSAIRYYEDVGLLHSIGRKGLQRVFHDSVIDRLALIAFLQKSGFSIKEIQQIFAVDAHEINKTEFVRKAEEIEQQIEYLTRLSSGLRHVANCSYENPLECNHFKSILKNMSA